jgi:aspartate aminotransferase, cytoplasmic
MGSASSPWAFTADVVPQAPEDPLFGLMAAYRKDTSPKKVDLGIGAYRDNNAKPWVLPVVKKVRAVLKLNSLRPVLMSFYRPMKSCVETQTSTTNIYPSQAW